MAEASPSGQDHPALAAAEGFDPDLHANPLHQGLDMGDDSLAETPQRIAKMYVEEIFSGLDYQQFPKITLIENKMGVDEMVKVRDITMTSTCEHHLVTIDGLATVAYLPRSKVLGLSKINRIVQFFAQRPQVQERLTVQIRDCIQEALNPMGVAVVIVHRLEVVDIDQ